MVIILNSECGFWLKFTVKHVPEGPSLLEEDADPLVS